MTNAAATKTTTIINPKTTRSRPGEAREGVALRRENARVPVVATFVSLDAMARAFCGKGA